MPVDYSGQDLRGRDFSGQDLRGAIQTGATLRDANLSNANFTNADLSYAFRRPGISRADMEGAEGLETIKGLVD